MNVPREWVYLYCSCDWLPWRWIQLWKYIPKPNIQSGYFIYTDVEECYKQTYACDMNATCTNTDGSYICTCPSSELPTVPTIMEHLRIVTCERSYYKTMCCVIAAWRNSGHSQLLMESSTHLCLLQLHLPTPSIQVHYSFDYAQQVHYNATWINLLPDPEEMLSLEFAVMRQVTVARMLTPSSATSLTITFYIGQTIPRLHRL